MSEYDYFNESVPDAISNAIDAYDDSIQPSGQDGYELLVATFGSTVCGNDLKSATKEHYEKFAKVMEEYFELNYSPTENDAKEIINKALKQWGG